MLIHVHTTGNNITLSWTTSPLGRKLD